MGILKEIINIIINIFSIIYKLSKKGKESLISVEMTCDCNGQLSSVYFYENSVSVNDNINKDELLCIKVKIKNIGEVSINDFYIGRNRRKLEYLRGTENLKVDDWFELLLCFEECIFSKDDKEKFIIAYTVGKNYRKHLNRYIIAKEGYDYDIIDTRNKFRKKQGINRDKNE